MRSKIVNGVRVLTVNFKQVSKFFLPESEEFLAQGPDGDGLISDGTIAVAKSGSRVYLYEDGDTLVKAITDEYKPNQLNELSNISAGPKTLASFFERALSSDKTVKTSRVGSGYSSVPVLQLRRKGQRVLFVAPCGAQGWLTVRETEKLVEGLRGL